MSEVLPLHAEFCAPRKLETAWGASSAFPTPAEQMETTEKSIIVDATPEEAFEQWTRLEDFPRFWTTIGEVRQLEETRFFVRGEQDGQSYEMIAEVTVRIPGQRIAWRILSGPASSGAICFSAEPGGKTRITLKILYEPDVGWQQPAAVAERIESALRKFKERFDPN